jgi:hypothetical protein
MPARPLCEATNVMVAENMGPNLAPSPSWFHWLAKT